jgi:hypothetical protein
LCVSGGRVAVADPRDGQEDRETQSCENSITHVSPQLKNQNRPFLRKEALRRCAMGLLLGIRSSPFELLSSFPNLDFSG